MAADSTGLPSQPIKNDIPKAATIIIAQTAQRKQFPTVALKPGKKHPKCHNLF